MHPTRVSKEYVFLIRHYDGLVNARSAINRAIKHCLNDKDVKELKEIYDKLDKRVKELRQLK
jgi:hypothetical protein